MKWSISVVDNTNRKYEFSFLSREKGVAVSYSRDRINLSNEKFDILQANSEGIQLIYIVDIINSGVTSILKIGINKP